MSATGWGPGVQVIIRIPRVFKAVVGLSVVLVVLIVLAPILVPYLVQRRIRARLHDRRIMKARRDQAYLVWHARRGWRDFVQNNLLPVLPSEAVAVQDRRRGGAELRALRDALIRRQMMNVRRPVVVLVGRRSLFVQSLNAELWPQKRHARRDPAVQGYVRATVKHALETCARLHDQ